MRFATRANSWGYLPGFRLSPLYGFSSPFGDYAKNKWANLALNLLMLFLLPPVMLLKNLIILPVADSVSFLLRCLLTVLDPLSRGVAYGIGLFLKVTGIFWDNSIGLLFNLTAYTITLGCNKLDNWAGHFKQKAVAKIQVGRRSLYHWAFSEEEEAFHKTHNDVEHFLDPMKFERLPHTSTGCVLENLLSNVVQNLPDEENPKHTTLFHSIPGKHLGKVIPSQEDAVLYKQTLTH